MSEWWRMKPVDPGQFALLRVEEATEVLWNLCSAHGQVQDLVRALEARRERHAAAVVNAILADIEATSA